MTSPDFTSSPPSIKEDQPPVVKNNNNGETERIIMTERRTFLIMRSMLDNEYNHRVYGEYIDGEREMTDAEIELYNAAVDASDMFEDEDVMEAFSWLVGRSAS